MFIEAVSWAGAGGALAHDAVLGLVRATADDGAAWRGSWCEVK
jgi:hypothetical protein